MLTAFLFSLDANPKSIGAKGERVHERFLTYLTHILLGRVVAFHQEPEFVDQLPTQQQSESVGREDAVVQLEIGLVGALLQKFLLLLALLLLIIFDFENRLFQRVSEHRLQIIFARKTQTKPTRVRLGNVPQVRVAILALDHLLLLLLESALSQLLVDLDQPIHEIVRGVRELHVPEQQLSAAPFDVFDEQLLDLDRKGVRLVLLHLENLDVLETLDVARDVLAAEGRHLAQANELQRVVRLRPEGLDQLDDEIVVHFELGQVDLSQQSRADQRRDHVQGLFGLQRVRLETEHLQEDVAGGLDPGQEVHEELLRDELAVEVDTQTERLLDLEERVEERVQVLVLEFELVGPVLEDAGQVWGQWARYRTSGCLSSSRRTGSP